MVEPRQRLRQLEDRHLADRGVERQSDDVVKSIRRPLAGSQDVDRDLQRAKRMAVALEQSRSEFGGERRCPIFTDEVALRFGRHRQAENIPR